MDKIKIIMLGGQDESFKNMVAVEINNDIFVIEVGFKLPDKTKPGIDFIIPRYDYLVANKEKVKAYLITHGYDSVMGALPYIYEKVPAPIFCTGTTADALKGFCTHNNLDYSKLLIFLLFLLILLFTFFSQLAFKSACDPFVLYICFHF